MRKLFYLVVPLMAIAAVILASCASPGTQPPAPVPNPPAGGGTNIISGTGVVKFIELEGGFFGIVGDDGKNYDPLNLSPEFKKDGLRVRFEAKRKDVATIRMWGTTIEITKIEKLP